MEEFTSSSEETKVAAKENAPVVFIDQQGFISFQNQMDLANAAKLLIATRVAPEHLRKEGVAAVMAAVLLCKQLNLPANAMNEMAWIKGKITCYGSLYGALASRHPDYGEHEIIFLDANQDEISYLKKNLNAEVWACVILLKKKGSEKVNQYYFTWDEAKAAGLSGSPTYKSYRKDMLYARARSRAFNDSYASALKGIESYEEVVYEAEREASPLDDLNNRLGLKKGEEI